MTTKIKVKKPILYLHVNATNKAFFQKLARGLSVNEGKRITDSAVADKILANLRNNPKLLTSVLK